MKGVSSKLKYGVIAVLVFLLFGFACVAIGYNLKETESKRSAATATLVDPLTTETILAAVNEKREESGTPPLVMNSLLNLSASNKCKDMSTKGYWSHDSPDGGKFWVFVQAANYKYRLAGENLGYGFDGTSGLLRKWTDSKGHLRNMVDGRFTETGIAICQATNYQETEQTSIVVQHFGTPL